MNVLLLVANSALFVHKWLRFRVRLSVRLALAVGFTVTSHSVVSVRASKVVKVSKVKLSKVK